MKSLTDIPSEYKCHQNFYRMVWGDLACKECGNKGLLFRKTYEYCPHCKKKYSVKADTSLFKFCNLSFRQIYALIWCWQHKCSIGYDSPRIFLISPILHLCCQHHISA